MNFQPFSLLLGFGASLGLAWVIWRVPQKEREPLLIAGLWVLLGALIGARAAFIITNAAYFAARPQEIFQIWQGGLSWTGAVIGALLILLLVAYLQRTSPGALADRLLPLALTLSVSGWLGCWLSGCAYGAESNMAILSVPAMDESGTLRLRFPLQMLTAALLTLCFTLLERLRVDLPRPGQFASLGLALLCGLQFAASFLRADPALLWRHWRVESWAALGCTLLMLILFLSASLPIRLPWHFRQKDKKKGSAG